jgi:DNA-binding transcriptional regulator YhcF (GntR family)
MPKTIEPPLDETKSAKALRTNEKKWGKPLMDAGWSAIPNILIEKQAALGLDSVDINLILHLQSYWWKAEDHPHPSIGTMAKALNVTERTIQRRLRALQANGFLTIEARKHATNGNATNVYKFDGLIKAARPFAVQKNQEKAMAAEMKAVRLKAKKAQPATASSTDAAA